VTASDKRSRWRIRTRTKTEALKRYRGFLQRSLNCISDVQWYAGPGRSDDEFVLLTRETPIPLKRGVDSTLYLTASQNFRYEKDPRWGKTEWKVRTGGYADILGFSERHDPELVAWQWHPRSKVKVPHAHVSAAHDDVRSFRKLHIPTGRVSFESIVRFAIEDLSAVPLRENWADILGETEGRFKEFQTWK
jgi:hypothetical protein